MRGGAPRSAGDLRKPDMGKWSDFFKARTGRRYLRDFVRLVIAFFACLVILIIVGVLLFLGIYQQLRLYELGVLDDWMNRNLMLTGLHHLGYASLVSIPLAFIFNGLEKFKPGWGFRISIVLLLGLLLWELILTEYYLRHFDLPSSGVLGNGIPVGIPGEQTAVPERKPNVSVYPGAVQPLPGHLMERIPAGECQ